LLIIVWNTDDDNNNGIADYLELAGPVAGEDDLVKITLDPWLRDDMEELDFRVRPQFSGIRLWDSHSKGKEIITDNDYLWDEFPDELYAEGIKSPCN